MYFSKTPSKSKCLAALRKVYPGAEIKPLPSGGLQLTYQPPNERERRPVLEVVPKAKGIGKDALAFAVVKAAFGQLGYATTYKPGFPSGKFLFAPLKSFTGPEEQIPVELDPTAAPTVPAETIGYSAPMPTGLQASEVASTEMLIPNPNTEGNQS